MDYPGIILNDSSNRVHGFLFNSENLANHWHVLDEFEGEEYECVPANGIPVNRGYRDVLRIYAHKSRMLEILCHSFLIAYYWNDTELL